MMYVDNCDSSACEVTSTRGRGGGTPQHATMVLFPHLAFLSSVCFLLLASSSSSTMIILFFLMLSMLRGQMRDSGTERDDRDRVAVLTKADSSSSSSSSSGGPARRDDDHDRDMIQ